MPEEDPVDIETEEKDIRKHLEDAHDHCGCVEIWEHLSEKREREENE